jgi:hypothetical protein
VNWQPLPTFSVAQKQGSCIFGGWM